MGGETAPTIPAGTECLGGVWPSSVLFPINLFPNDLTPTAVDLSYYDRKMWHCPDGTIIVLGDSIVQDMIGSKISRFVETFGVGGETLRRCFNRIARGGLIHRAGAVVLATGINDLANFTYNGQYTPQQLANGNAYLHAALAAQATGKWVIRDILPVDEPVLCATVNAGYAGMNVKIDLTNQAIRAAWANSAAQVAFVGLREQLVDSSGNLADANHIDGMHLSRAGDDIQCASIKAALQALGVI
jgi:hypothetical protein